MSCLVRSAAALLVAIAAPGQSAAADPPPLTLEHVLAATRPAPEELSTQVDLWRARQLAAVSSRGLASGWTLAISGGPRRAPEVSDADLAAELEIPLLTDDGARPDLLESLEQAEALLPSAARGEALAVVATAFVDAWAAQEIEAARGEVLAATETWLATARSRVAVGADAPFEAELVALERHRAAAALVEARAHRLAAWGSLAAVATLPAQPVALAPPPTSPRPDAESARRLLRSSLALRAVEARTALARSMLALQRSRDESRWALRSTLAREGDEAVAHLGVAYRWPRRDERRLLRAATEAEFAALARAGELARAALSSRLESALAFDDGEPLASRDGSISIAQSALTARLLEGKALPSEVLPVRLQLLAAAEATIERRAALARAAATLFYLIAEPLP